MLLLLHSSPTLPTTLPYTFPTHYLQCFLSNIAHTPIHFSPLATLLFHSSPYSFLTLYSSPQSRVTLATSHNELRQAAADNEDKAAAIGREADAEDQRAAREPSREPRSEFLVLGSCWSWP